MPRRWSYRQSGVDRATLSEALRALLRGVTYRPPADHGRPVPLKGHYAGLVRLGRETVAITTDTVGTKVLLAEATGQWETVGTDLVGVNVNDLAAVGARPAGLVDTILLDRPRPEVLRAVGRGINRGLREAQCALLGGETAAVPDLVRGIDLGGTAIGFYPRGRSPVTGARVRPGDVVLGIPSYGLHANGFTLVRQLLAARRVGLRRPRPGGRGPVGTELLRAQRIYCRAVESIAAAPGLTGLAHITGGGVRNLVRLRAGVRFELDGWPDVPGLFRWIQGLGNLSNREMFQTFNMGIGFCVIARARASPDLVRRLRAAGAPDVRPIGRIVPGSGVELPRWSLEYTGYAG